MGEKRKRRVPTRYVIPGTFSKDQKTWGFPRTLTVDYAKGATLYLSDERDYLDWVSGLGTNLLGYQHVPMTVNDWVLSPSLPLTIEYEVAEKLAVLLKEHVPGWRDEEILVRFCKTGTDATSMAVRLARAFTQNATMLIYSHGYHGWQDWSVAKTSPSYGIPDVLTYYIRNFNIGEELYGNAAGVILECPAVAVPDGWYDDIAQYCKETGALFIVDEVVTGLRYGLGGACERFGISPDLICLGKSLGNGAPIAALVGKREDMEFFDREDPVFCSSTVWGEGFGLRMADHVLTYWGHEEVAYIRKIGQKLMDGLREVGYDVIGHDVRSVIRFESEVHRAQFIHGMFEEGILMNRPNFPSLAHTEDDVGRTIRAAARVLFMFREKEWKKSDFSGRLPRVLFSSR